MTPDAGAFEPWLHAIPGFSSARVLSIEPVSGGASNITCRVTIADGPVPAVALRIQRDRGIFEPYDVIREGEVLRRLAPSSIPVPTVIGSEPDPAVLGGPFIVMQWIDAPHMGEAGPEADYGAYTAMVVAIHALDWQRFGLDLLGTPSSPAEAVRAELDSVARRMTAFGCECDPLLVRALQRLQADAPADGRLTLCQGDINVFNYLFRQRRVVGVVDWEQARISDPRSDIGQLVALGNLRGAPFGRAEDANFVRSYEAVSGVPLWGMEYFRARWLFELGVIYHGWKKFNDSDPWYSWAQLATALERSLDALD